MKCLCKYGETPEECRLPRCKIEMSQREIEDALPNSLQSRVVDLWRKGKTDSEIAQETGVSIRTVQRRLKEVS